jgi:hypothetical protein
MNASGLDEVSDLKVMRQVPKSSFANPFRVLSGFAVELLEAPCMVRFDAACAPGPGRAGAYPHEKIAGVPVEVVIEKYQRRGYAAEFPAPQLPVIP